MLIKFFVFLQIFFFFLNNSHAMCNLVEKNTYIEDRIISVFDNQICESCIDNYAYYYVINIENELPLNSINIIELTYDYTNIGNNLLSTIEIPKKSDLKTIFIPVWPILGFREILIPERLIEESKIYMASINNFHDFSYILRMKTFALSESLACTIL